MSSVKDVKVLMNTYWENTLLCIMHTFWLYTDRSNLYCRWRMQSVLIITLFIPLPWPFHHDHSFRPSLEAYCSKYSIYKTCSKMFSSLFLGRGGRKGALEVCPSCRGSGVQVRLHQLGFGMVQQVSTMCCSCQGQGQRMSHRDRCKTCTGRKILRQKKILEVHIDKGWGNFYFAGTVFVWGEDINGCVYGDCIQGF